MNNYVIITAVLSVILLLVFYAIVSKKSTFYQPWGSYHKSQTSPPQLSKGELSYSTPKYIHQMVLNNGTPLHEIDIGPKPVSNAKPGGPARAYV